MYVGKASCILGHLGVLFFFGSLTLRAQNLPVPSSGSIVRLDSRSYADLPPRIVDVWLPPQYQQNPEQRFPVLYMNDGQNLFDGRLSFGGKEWGVDETFKDSMLPPCIVVGIWNSPQRRREYGPQACYAALPKFLRDSICAEFGGFPVSDTYLAFIVNSLKPEIDRLFRTLPDRKHTMVAGSSFGGLISMYALCEYPDVFGAAACISTHWPGSIRYDYPEIPEAFLNYLERKTRLLRKKNSRIYFDCGNRTLDSLYPSWQKKADRILQRKLAAGQWQSLFFPEAEHNEQFWRKRLAQPLRFLLQD
ncbi:MAG: esterase [Bacteroidetes bacterium]|nr:esterase [Bacteroidota bacterium]